MDQNHKWGAFPEAFGGGFAEEGGELIATSVCEWKAEPGRSLRVNRSD